MQLVALYLATYLLFLQILTYVELSGGQNSSNGSELHYMMYHKSDKWIQLAINEVGPFPSPPGGGDGDRECTLCDLLLI